MWITQAACHLPLRKTNIHTIKDLTFSGTFFRSDDFYSMLYFYLYLYSFKVVSLTHTHTHLYLSTHARTRRNCDLLSHLSFGSQTFIVYQNEPFHYYTLKSLNTILYNKEASVPSSSCLPLHIFQHS